MINYDGSHNTKHIFAKFAKFAKKKLSSEACTVSLTEIQ